MKLILFYRVEIKNLGGGKHQLVFNKLDMTDTGEIMCKSGELTSSCKLEVKKGESKPQIDFGDLVEAPANHPITFNVPFKGQFLKLSSQQLMIVFTLFCLKHLFIP